MAGTVYLGCGSPSAETALWRLMLDRPLTRIIFWPFALPPAMLDDADRWLRDHLDRLGAVYELGTWRRADQHLPSELDDADLLLVGGGNTFRLLDHAVRSGHIDPVRRFVERGGDYYGGSAGAVLACDDIAVAEGHDANDLGLVDLTGLGLVPGVSVLPHFTMAQLSSAQEWVVQHGRTVVGLPDNAGLVQRDGIATVVGAGDVHLIAPSRIRTFSTGASFACGPTQPGLSVAP